MNFLYYEFNVSAGAVIEVTLDKQANVKLLDWSNFQNYRQGRAYRYSGGLAQKSPIHISIPQSGRWFVVIDLGGYSGTVRASARLIN